MTLFCAGCLIFLPPCWLHSSDGRFVGGADMLLLGGESHLRGLWLGFCFCRSSRIMFFVYFTLFLHNKHSSPFLLMEELLTLHIISNVFSRWMVFFCLALWLCWFFSDRSTHNLFPLFPPSSCPPPPSCRLRLHLYGDGCSSRTVACTQECICYYIESRVSISLHT